MAGANLALVFGAIFTGAVIIDYGVRSMRGAFGTSSSSAMAAPAPSTAGKSQGSVNYSDLQGIGAQYGWTGSQLDAWWNVIAAESGGNPAARNPSSGAFGIGQFLGATLQKYAPFGAASSDPAQQLEAMARYIHDRYGSPAVAWAHESLNHWY